MSNQTHSFVGNLTRDPEYRTVAGKNGDVGVVHFSVAVNGRTKDEVVYFECEAWAQGAEVISKWFKKGTPIVVNDAEAKNDTWVDKTTGEKRSRLKFRVNRFGFAPSNGNGNKETPVENEEETVTSEKEKEETVETPKVTRRGRPPKVEPTTPSDDEEIPF